jgi:hypothetical protein
MISNLIQNWENEEAATALCREIDLAQKEMRKLYALRVLPETTMEAYKSERRVTLESLIQLTAQALQTIRTETQRKVREHWMTPRTPVLNAVKILLKTSEILEALAFRES